METELLNTFLCVKAVSTLAFSFDYHIFSVIFSFAYFKNTAKCKLGKTLKYISRPEAQKTH